MPRFLMRGFGTAYFLYFIFYILFSVRGRLKGTKIVRFEWMAQSVVSKTVQRGIGVRVKEGEEVEFSY